MVDTLLVVGAGHAANALVSSLVKHRYAGRVVLVGDEPHLPYNRPPLSKKFLNEEALPEELYFRGREQFAKLGIDVHLSDASAAIDPDGRKVILRSGTTVEYTRLVLATGASPRRLSADVDRSRGRVHVLRNAADAIGLRTALRDAEKVVILGAGYVGLEVAASCRGAGKVVTVVEAAPRVLARVAGADLSEIVRREHEARGVAFHLGRAAVAVEEAGRGLAVTLDDGTRLDADLVLCAIGAVPNTDLAEAAGIRVERGIVVDRRCRTSRPDIFAIGDCATFPHDGELVQLESVQNASEQAETVARGLCGIDAEYAPVPWFWSDQYDMRLQSVGRARATDDAVLRSQAGSHAVWRHRDGRITALDTINAPREHLLARKLMSRGELRLDALVEAEFDLSRVA